MTLKDLIVFFYAFSWDYYYSFSRKQQKNCFVKIIAISYDPSKIFNYKLNLLFIRSFSPFTLFAYYYEPFVSHLFLSYQGKFYISFKSLRYIILSFLPYLTQKQLLLTLKASEITKTPSPISH